MCWMKSGLKSTAGLALVMLILFQGCATVAGKPVPVAEEQGQVPKAPELVLGPGDKIDISVYRHDDLSKTFQVDLSGKIMYPLVGDLQVAGLTTFMLRDKLREGLSRFMVEPQVTINVAATANQKVIVLGEVKSPGYFQADTSVTALEAIARAGGFTSDGQTKTVLLIRGGLQKPDLYTLNLQKALAEGDLRQNVVLQRGDIVYVPRQVIADVDIFFKHITSILQPFVLFETGIFLNQQIQQGGTASVAP